MSKVPVIAGFDIAEILMLTAGILLITTIVLMI